MEYVKMLERYVFLEHRNVLHIRDGWKKNHVLPYHTYLIFDDLNLNGAVVSAYAELMQRDVLNKWKLFP